MSSFTIFEEHTREVTAMYQEVPRAVRWVVPVFFGDFGRENPWLDRTGWVGDPSVPIDIHFYHALGEVEFYTIKIHEIP